MGRVRRLKLNKKNVMKQHWYYTLCNTISKKGNTTKALKDTTACTTHAGGDTHTKADQNKQLSAHMQGARTQLAQKHFREELSAAGKLLVLGACMMVAGVSLRLFPSVRSYLPLQCTAFM